MITSQQLADIGVNPSEFEKLSFDEKEVVSQILSEIANEKNSVTYERLYEADYEEIPVDFLTFISDDRYLGKSTRNGSFLYPFWKQEDCKILARSDINEVALSGSIGTGKSTNGVLLLIYHLYKTMCMRDPQSFFNLSPGSEISYAFLNNTLESSYGVAYKTFQAFVQESPWFLKHGSIQGRTEPLYYPEKGFGFIVGSKPQHTLGKHVICLTGDTEIVTSDGVKRIDELVGQTIQVISYDGSGTVVSSQCTVCETKKVDRLIEIELEDGTILKCTAEHRLMLKDGTYKMAKDLSENDELLDIG